MTPACPPAPHGVEPRLAIAPHSVSTLDCVHHTDLLTLCNGLAAQSIDMILADLPYGTTACSWDVRIPFEPMWAAFRRVIKPRGAIVLTASQPFTSLLVCSNLEMFKYLWYWQKSNVTNFGNAQHQPLRVIEDICVFNARKYNPQGLSALDKIRRNSQVTGGIGTGAFRYGELYKQDFTNYPVNVLKFSSVFNTVHPTQKPLALFEYLIRTYTQPGDVVLDPVVGSGTTAVAARKTGRRFIVGDSSLEYVEIARNRLQNTDPYLDRIVAPGLVQQSLFAGVPS